MHTGESGHVDSTRHCGQCLAVVILIGGVLAAPLSCRDASTKDARPMSSAPGVRFEVRRLDPVDEAFAEEWARAIDTPRVRELHGVGAQKWRNKPSWPWRVEVWVMEFVRDDPLEAELRRRIDAALRAVPGVTDVREDDREVWGVEGSPSGDALVSAVGAVVDSFADRTCDWCSGCC
jgi:hypothetical protein